MVEVVELVLRLRALVIGARPLMPADVVLPQLAHTATGIDEAELASGKISWLSPVARALMKARIGDVIEFRTPSGPDTLEVLSIAYGTRRLNGT